MGYTEQVTKNLEVTNENITNIDKSLNVAFRILKDSSAEIQLIDSLNSKIRINEIKLELVKTFLEVQKIEMANKVLDKLLKLIPTEES
jgi:RNA recognition motif-containing protein